MFKARHLVPVVMVVGSAVSAGEGLFSQGRADRMQLFDNQSTVLDQRFGVRSVPVVSTKSAPAPVSVARGLEPQLRKVTPRGRHVAIYLDEAKRQAKAFAIPEALFLALIQQESAWNSKARSHVGAIGLTQLMPGTATDLRVDPHDPVQNLHGGAKYLREQYDRFGDWRLALAAYNAGPGAVKKYGGVPPYRETRNYVRRILGK